MAMMLPALAMGIPAVLSAIGGIMGIANEGRKLARGDGLRKRRMATKGGRIMWPKFMTDKRQGGRVTKRVGRGQVANILGSIPLLGSFLGPIASAFGGKLGRRRRSSKRSGGATMKFVPYKGKGLSPMHIRGIRQIYNVGGRVCGGRLTPGSVSSLYQKLAAKGGRVQRKKYGKSLAMPQYKRSVFVPSKTGGLLSPAGRGGAISTVKGYYKYLPSGQRVHVRAHVKGAGIKLARKTPKRGGYVPYAF